MHSSTNGFPWHSHFVQGLRWQVVPKRPCINLGRLTEMPLSAPSGQYTVCHLKRACWNSFFFFFFSVFAFCWYYICMF